MDSNVRHNRGDHDKYVRQARQEMDKNMQRERELMDKNMKQERATMDRMRKEERAAVEQLMTEERAAVDQRLKHFHDDMDLKLKQERKDLDRTIQLERGRIEFDIMQERANMDLMLQQERNDMDHKAKMEQIWLEGNMMQDRAVELERGKMDVNTVQSRAYMERKLHQERNDPDYKAKMEQIRMEGSMMQDHAGTGTKHAQAQQDIRTPEQSVSSPPVQTQRDILPPEQSVSSPRRRVVVMEFIVHVDYELSHVPQAYHNERPGMTTVLEPGKVDWDLMVKNLRYHGYKGNADLYYIKPGCVPPEGMVQISGQDDVDEMLHALEGIKECHLYIVKNCAFSDDSNDVGYGYQQEDMHEEDIYSCGYVDIGERDLGEYGSSPKRKKLADNNPKKALDFGSSDEPLQ